MDLAFTTMNTVDDIRPDRLARMLEDRGYGALFIGEHSHIPASRRTPYPAGGEMPGQYREMMDPFVSLAQAATATTTLQLGLGVCLVLEHDLLDLAKSVATLDVLSGGRVLFGVGVGWNVEELANHRPDIAWGARYLAAEECVAALRACWTEEVSSFHGRYFDIDGVWSFPKPVQRPHPPVIVGTSGKLGTAHALRWGDEWMPMDVGLGNVERTLTKVRQMAAEAGRALPVTLVAFGDPNLDTLRLYRDLGVTRCVLGSGRRDWADPASAEPFIDRYATLIEELT